MVHPLQISVICQGHTQADIMLTSVLGLVRSQALKNLKITLQSFSDHQ